MSLSTNGMSYKINEIFYSLQGEGHYTGTPAVFVRFSGCNLHCDFCDTDFSKYVLMTEDEIVNEVSRLLPFDLKNSPHADAFVMVVLTGGEPSLQLTAELLDALHRIVPFVTIETNGTRPLPEGVDWVTCSPKENTKLQVQHVDELKVVYQGQDVEKYMSVPAKYRYLQPCSMLNTDEVIEYVLRHPWWRLSLQTHKFTGIR